MERRAEVFIAPDDPVPPGEMTNPDSSPFWVSWQDNDEGGEGPLEDDHVTGAEAAIAWGRERSRVVWIRLGHSDDTYFSAGDDHPADHGGEHERVPHWPPKALPERGWWRVPPFPTLAEVDDVAARVRRGELAEEEARRWAQDRMATVAHLDSEPDHDTFVALVTLLENRTW